MRSHRLWMMWVASIVVLGWYYFTDPDGGIETLARIQWLAWILVITGPVYWLRRALLDGARSHEAFRKALEHPIGAGLAFLGLSILTGALVLALAGRANAADGLPPGAVKYLPMLESEQKNHWPDVPMRSALAAQVEQETCPSLKSAKCWNPRAELKTSREYGFGLGQLTVTPKFDNFKEARKLDSSLNDWKFEDRYDPARQLRTMVLMDRGANRYLVKMVPDERERLAMSFSAYNGGLGGVLSDRRLCSQKPGCDPTQWFGNVEQTSLKAKSKTAGYGKSFFDINREYVRNIMYVRRERYASWFGED